VRVYVCGCLGVCELSGWVCGLLGGCMYLGLCLRAVMAMCANVVFAFCTLCICSFKGKNSCVLGESAVRTSLLGLARYCGFSPLARCVIDRHALCFG
jgi:hypothetical protein